MTLRQAASIFKLRIGVTIALAALVGAAVAPGEAPAAWQILILALVTLGASASSGAFNQIAERDLDARMTRTKTRPFVTGEQKAGALWYGAVLLLLTASVGVAAWVFNPAVGVHLFLGAFFYGVVYTVWLKRRTWLNIVVGGLSGSFAVLAGASAVDPGLAPIPVILAVVLFLWTPPHFWALATALKKDYAQAGVPMLPVVVGDRKAAWVIFGHTAALATLSLVPVAYGMGWIYLVGAASGGLLFVWAAVKLVRRPDRASAMRTFFASLVQLTLMSVGAIVDTAVFGVPVALWG